MEEEDYKAREMPKRKEKRRPVCNRTEKHLLGEEAPTKGRRTPLNERIILILLRNMDHKVTLVSLV